MMGFRCCSILLSLLACASGTASAAVSLDAVDKRAIHAVALDYAEGWYRGDRVRMERSLHDALAKRSYPVDQAGVRRLDEMDKQRLLAGTRPENLARYKDAPRRTEVEILDAFSNSASVKLVMDEWVDYMHVVRDEQGEWRVINVLWERLSDDVDRSVDGGAARHASSTGSTH